MRRAICGTLGTVSLLLITAACRRPEGRAADPQPEDRRTLAPASVSRSTPEIRRAPFQSVLPTAAAPLPAAQASPPIQCPLDRSEERAQLVRETIEKEGIRDLRVLGALQRVPRHWFVPNEVRGQAYRDRPLPIGHGQTISQPFIVAAMTAAVAPKPTDKCLEVGTGSGYQAAVLAELCAHTYSIEYLPEVAKLGAANLRRCGYGPNRISLRVGDGYQGWSDQAPFEVVVVTAAPERVPEPLLDQLAVAGRLVIPVGRQRLAQELELWTRLGPGKGKQALRRQHLLDVVFVPMLGQAQQEGD
ncbi:protein-L-isoaspartate(D-aspartate) O-methyltransferase [Myxococcota bacterium]